MHHHHQSANRSSVPGTIQTVRLLGDDNNEQNRRLGLVRDVKLSMKKKTKMMTLTHHQHFRKLLRLRG
jgi:hypothetical protein